MSEPTLAAPVATADVWPHPLTSEGRTTLPLEGPATVRGLLDRVWTGPYADVEVWRNGRHVPGPEWDLTPVRDRDVVTVRASLGDGGGGGSNPLNVILQIGVLAVATWAGPALAGSIFTAGTTAATWAGRVLTAAIMVGGSMVVNALVPPYEAADRPVSPGADADPVYSLAAGANRARPWEPLPLVLGTHRMHPDLAAQPYTEYEDNDQYLVQVFSYGLGNLDISDHKIGDTPLSSYEDLGSTPISSTGGAIAGIYGNVDTAEGGELTEVGAAADADDPDEGWIVRTTSADVVRIGIDLVGRVFRVSGGRVSQNSVDVKITWHNVLTPTAKSSRTISISHDKSEPVRHSEHIDVPKGQYVVRLTRATEPDDSDQVYDSLNWTVLRSYQQDPAQYRGVNREGWIIRASGQLQGRLDRVSATVKQKIPTWGGSAWNAPAPSSNPAWIYRWYAKGVYIDGRLVAGMGLSDSEIDDDAVKSWGAWCAAQDLRCDYVVAGRMSHYDVLTLIARCGRARPTWAPGKLSVVWDQAGKLPSESFTPGSIVQGSFAVEWVGDEVADEIVVQFVDPDLDWQPNTVRRTVPGVTTPRRTSTIRLPGVTRRTQAAVECNLQAARQRYHKRRLKWRVHYRDLRFGVGDVVYVSHSLIDGGVTGRVQRGSVSEIVLTRRVTLSALTDYVVLRMPDGALHTSVVTGVADADGQTDTLTLTTPMPLAPGAGGTSPLDILWRLHDESNPPRKVRIVGIRAAGDRQAEVEAIDEVDAYYQAATSDLSTALPRTWRHAPQVWDVAMGETLIRAGGGFAVVLSIALTVTGDWRGAVVYAATNGGARRQVAVISDGETRASWVDAASGNVVITVVPGTPVAPVGRPYGVTYQILGELVPPAPPSNFLIDILGDGTRRFRWTPAADVDLAGTEIRYYRTALLSPPAWDDMTPLFRGWKSDAVAETVEPAQGAWTFVARSRDLGGRLSSTDVRIIAEIGPVRRGDALIWECPSGVGWPGDEDGFSRSNDGEDALEGTGAYTWDNRTTWDAWVSWALGNGRQGGTRASYTHSFTLPAKTTFGLWYQGDFLPLNANNPDVEYRVSDTEDGLDTAEWTDYAEGVEITGQYLEVRWTLEGDGAVMLRADHLCVSIVAPVVAEFYRDVATGGVGAERTGGWELLTSGEDHFPGVKVPTDLTVTDLDVTIQDVTLPPLVPVLVNKNSPTVLRLQPTGVAEADHRDAKVDVVVRGLSAAAA